MIHYTLETSDFTYELFTTHQKPVTFPINDSLHIRNQYVSVQFTTHQKPTTFLRNGDISLLMNYCTSFLQPWKNTTSLLST